MTYEKGLLQMQQPRICVSSLTRILGIAVEQMKSFLSCEYMPCVKLLADSAESICHRYGTVVLVSAAYAQGLSP